MSSSPIGRSPDLLRLRNEGFNLEVRAGYLLVHEVPYATAQSTVARGTLAFQLDLTADIAVKPQNHTAYFIGACPCDAQGQALNAIINNSQSTTVNGITVNHYLSAKPRTPDGLYPDYYTKVTQYVAQIAGPAQALRPGMDAKGFRVVEATVGESVFAYEDTASTRAGIALATDRFKNQRIAIVGLGGTGAYVLDQVAKTPVSNIHLWDGDAQHQHNAFRSPGAMPVDALRATPNKANYWASVYGAMHRHIVPHAVMITAENAQALREFDHVFLCVDRAEPRRLILEALAGSSATLIDVGIGMRMNSANALVGQCRVSVVDPQRSAVAIATLPMAGADDDNLYTTNIQVADLNMINAGLAIHAWKTRLGFYASMTQSHLTVFATSNSTMATATDEGNACAA
ncbi:ThiF family adenylyltransferase [Luteibacter pinisoli]|uniref:ThiF family adenylyltransferase n=1 Tax=Luteibacter pinisoli TaxID=2589080 RepID=A0A4Y5Z3U1_9GAMM|nr:ThiF family adenylyltransferase [Luteibacter pinisoli]QDE39807.1 ThiF family adenylyltransferase [Luteibacter pinisoli]